MKRIVALLLTLACCLGLFGCKKAEEPVPSTAPTMPTEPPHQHTFTDWTQKSASSCTREGREERLCTACNYKDTRAIPTSAHQKRDNNNLCKNCMYVFVDSEAKVAELGVVSDSWYGAGVVANYAWDIKCWNGLVYRAGGDYDKNSGNTIFLAYDNAESKWKVTGSADDEAIHGFVEINGTLYAAGIDATSGWEWGNYYVLQEDGTWKQVRNLPNGIHNFDMIEHGGKIFAGLGTETVGNTVAVSEDGGTTWKLVPLYKDGKLFDLSSYKWTRTYKFVAHNGQLHALLSMQMGIGSKSMIFRYEDGKMVYEADAYPLLAGGISRNYWTGSFSFGDTCYLTAGNLYTVTDFSDPETFSTVPMPNKETVVDAFEKDGSIYVLTYSKNKNPHTHNTESYKIVIYKSTTGEEGSFEEVLSFDYSGIPLSFDTDGTCFYIGTGANLVSEKVGMTLRVIPDTESK